MQGEGGRGCRRAGGGESEGSERRVRGWGGQGGWLEGEGGWGLQAGMGMGKGGPREEDGGGGVGNGRQEEGKVRVQMKGMRMRVGGEMWAGGCGRGRWQEVAG